MVLTQEIMSFGKNWRRVYAEKDSSFLRCGIRFQRTADFSPAYQWVSKQIRRISSYIYKADIFYIYVNRIFKIFPAFHNMSFGLLLVILGCDGNRCGLGRRTTTTVTIHDSLHMSLQRRPVVIAPSASRLEQLTSGTSSSRRMVNPLSVLPVTACGSRRQSYVCLPLISKQDFTLEYTI